MLDGLISTVEPPVRVVHRDDCLRPDTRIEILEL